MQNFGRIKNTLNELVSEGIGLKGKVDSKNLFKDYLKLIKESKILRAQFLVYNNIENKVEPDLQSALEFIKENISLMSKFSISDIKAENDKVEKLLSKNPKGLNESYDQSGLHDSLGFLITTKKTPSNIDLFSKHFKIVAEMITRNEVKEIFEQIELPKSMVSSILIDKYNEKYLNIDESTKNIIKAVIGSDDETKQKIFKDIVRECITKVDLNLKSADLTTKESLLMVKDKLLTKEILDMNNFELEIGKLENLRTSLTNV